MNTRPSLRSIFWGRNSFDFIIAAAKSLPRLGGALATVAATRLTALRALRFKYSKLVEPNFAVLFALGVADSLPSSPCRGNRGTARCVGSPYVSCAPSIFAVVGNRLAGPEPAPVEPRLVVENGFAGFEIASCNAGCWAYGLLSFARRLSN